MNYLKFTIIIAVGIVGFLAVAAPARADYYAQGVLKSENILLDSSVDSIDSAEVVATVPAMATTSISFSQDRVHFYNSSGTKGGWDTCSDGTTNIDLSGLAWDGAVLYYKLKLETSDSEATPTVSQVKVVFTGTAEGSPTRANAHYQGVLLSKNILSGAMVESINSVTVVSSEPAGTSVEIQFSSDGDTFYNSSGTEWGWDSCQNGTTTIDLSGLGWSDPELYYKLKLETIDSAMRASVSKVSVDFEGSNDGPASNEDGYYAEGAYLSKDLISGRDQIFSEPAYFAYHISYLSRSAYVQFSRDGETFYSSDGTEWGWDTLSEGSYLTRETALNLDSLGWNGADHFYYKVKFVASDDQRQSPVLESAGLLTQDKTKVNTPQTYSLTDGLVGYWSFDGQDVDWGSNTAYDGSKQSNDGTMVNMSTSTSAVTGVQGQGLDFDGSDDYVEANGAARAPAFTVSGWVNPDNTSRGVPWSFHNSGVNRNLFFWAQDDSTQKFYHWDATNNYVESTNTFSVSAWHHIGWVVDGSGNGKMYVNGIEEATWSNSDMDSVNQFSIGQEWDDNTASDFFDGTIDDVRIYDRALSEEEIQKLYRLGSRKLQANSPAPQRQASGLVGYWSFDGQDVDWGSNTAYDRSGNANHGAITNMSTSTSAAIGVQGQGLDFDGSDDYVDATVTQSTTSISVWYDSGDGFDHLVKADGSYYVNGASAVPDTFPVYISGDTVQIGKDEAGSLVAGKIDEVRIYNRALSENEIKKLYREGGRKIKLRQ